MAFSRILVLGVLVLAACAEDPGAVECATGIICPSGTTCAAAQPVCIVNNCGNGRVDSGESCDDGNIVVGDGCSPGCTLESCGDGVQVAGERCDDGNKTSGDGCSSDCLSVETCGNSIKDVTEACDDGNMASGDGCSGNCLSAEICGNGIKDVNETCDDGNTVGGDACSPNCEALAGCRNGIIDVDQDGMPVEECDDGDMVDTNNCRNNCKRAVCGDGVAATGATGGTHEECDGGTLDGTVARETADCNLDCTVRVCGDAKVNQTAGEKCDNGSTVDSADCDGDCTIPVCGDDRVNATLEACDPGTVGGNTASCDADCTTPACGDTHVNPAFTPVGGTVPEGCDDGATAAGDGCSPLCQIESCGNGVTDTVNGEECDDKNTNDLDGCRNNCQLPSCGDGVKSNSETCDTGGNSATCDFDCTVPQCGDSVINGSFTPTGGTATENCDDGGTTAGDGCSSVCRIESCGNGVTETATGEQCDDMNTNDLDGCRNNCQLPRCGDGVASASETCDTGGNSATCDFDCSAPSCNDGITNTAANEQCEDGNVTSGDGCSSTCRLEPFSLTVALAGNGAGVVTSNPAGINCGADCSELYLSGTVVTLTAAPAARSTFTGWTGACSGTGSCVLTMDAAKNVTANFAANRLTVTKSGAGSGTVTGTGITCGGDCTEDYNVGTMVTLTATASADSVFTGWSGGGCTGTSTCTVTMNAATTVNASFTLNNFTLTVTRAGNGNGNVSSVPGGIDCGIDCNENYTAGTVVTLIATATPDSTFTGWSGACSGTSNCVVAMTAARSVTATFTLKTFALTVTKNGNGTGTVTSTPAGINCGGTCTANFNANAVVTLTASTTGKNVFTGWSGSGCSGTGACQVTMDAAKSVNATFALNRLTVVREGDGTGTVTSAPAGINCGNKCSDDFNANQSVTLTATAAAGSRFDGWSGGGCTGLGPCTLTMSAPTTVTATFVDLDTLTVDFTLNGSTGGTVVSSPAGINCTADCNAEFDDGTTITLTATPAAGAVFTGWSGSGCSGTGTCVVTIAANTTVDANFAHARVLTVTKSGAGTGTVTSSPAGINCGGDCTQSYADGTSVTLTAVAGASSAFTGWSGACSGMGTCTVSMSAARTVTATFAVTHTLTVTKTEAGGTGAVSSSPAGISCGADCSQAYVAGTVVTLTATAATGSFTGWTGGGCSGTAPCDVTMSAAQSVTATFGP